MGNDINLRANIALGLIFAFLANIFGPVPIAKADDFVKFPITYSAEGELRLPAPGIMVSLSPAYNPAVLKGIKLDPKNPFRFHFFVDTGDSNHVVPARAGIQNQEQLKAESSKLIKYFLASLTIPEKDLWVNLSPYEKDRIVPQEFGQTEMGRDLLAEDYLLKQITASLIYPESRLGKEFWQKVYAQAQAKYGTTNVPINTFNKVWIVPDKAVVYENGGTAFVMENHLKVMLEEDYLSLAKHADVGVLPSGFPSVLGPHTGHSQLLAIACARWGCPSLGHPNISSVHSIASSIIREIVIPELTKEVNEGQNFAQLRQVFYSLILATWYKKKIKDSILVKVYENEKKVVGVGYEKSVILSGAQDLKVPYDSSAAPQNDTEIIYQQYLKAFKKGVYNYIKEGPDPLTGQTVPRKYFSGGVVGQITPVVEYEENMSRTQISALGSAKLVEISGDMAMIDNDEDFIQRHNVSLRATLKQIEEKGHYIGLIQSRNQELDGLINAGAIQAALQWINIFIQIPNQSLRSHYFLSSRRIECLFKLGESKTALDELYKERDELDKMAKTVHGNERDSLELIRLNFYEKGTNYIYWLSGFEKNINEAYRFALPIINYQPATLDGHLRMAQIYFNVNRLIECGKELKKHVQGNPTNPSEIKEGINLSKLLLRTMTQRKLKDIVQKIEHNPGDLIKLRIDINKHLDNLLQAGYFQETLKWIDEIWGLEGLDLEDFTSLQLRRVRALFKSGRVKEAMQKLDLWRDKLEGLSQRVPDEQKTWLDGIRRTFYEQMIPDIYIYTYGLAGVHEFVGPILGHKLESTADVSRSLEAVIQKINPQDKAMALPDGPNPEEFLGRLDFFTHDFGAIIRHMKESQLGISVKEKTWFITRSINDIDLHSNDLRKARARKDNTQQINELRWLKNEGAILLNKIENIVGADPHAADFLSQVIFARDLLRRTSDGDFVIAPVNLSRVISTAFSTTLDFYPELNDFDFEKNVEIQGDYLRIAEAFSNLFSNAQEAKKEVQKKDQNEEEPFRIKVIGRQSKDGKSVVVSVSDNGKGISPQDLPKIFDPFFTKGKEEGTGLGLAITKKIIEAHHGTITAESAFGQGTTFTIILPLAEKAMDHDKRYDSKNRILSALGSDGDARNNFLKIYHKSSRYSNDLIYLIEHFISVPGIKKIIKNLSDYNETYVLGGFGELYHALMLEKEGYKILYFDFEPQDNHVEIDIIIRKRKQIDLVEVKHTVSLQMYAGRKYSDDLLNNLRRKFMRTKQYFKRLQKLDHDLGLTYGEELRRQLTNKHIHQRMLVSLTYQESSISSLEQNKEQELDLIKDNIRRIGSQEGLDIDVIFWPYQSYKNFKMPQENGSDSAMTIDRIKEKQHELQQLAGQIKRDLPLDWNAAAQMPWENVRPSLSLGEPFEHMTQDPYLVRRFGNQANLIALWSNQIDVRAEFLSLLEDILKSDELKEPSSHKALIEALKELFIKFKLRFAQLHRTSFLGSDGMSVYVPETIINYHDTITPEMAGKVRAIAGKFSQAEELDPELLSAELRTIFDGLLGIVKIVRTDRSTLQEAVHTTAQITQTILLGQEHGLLFENRNKYLALNMANALLAISHVKNAIPYTSFPYNSFHFNDFGMEMMRLIRISNPGINFSQPLIDKATMAKGGIDLNPVQMNMQIKKEGEDFKFDFNGKEINAAEVTGATFTIRQMTPVTNLSEVLGLPN